MKILSRVSLLILSLFFLTLTFGQTVPASADDSDAPISIEGCTINPITDRTYTGNEITPGITLMMGEKKIGSSNYTLTYENNVNAGTATVTATGIGSYCGSVSAEFTIVPKYNTPKIFFEESKLTYNGKLQRPVIEKIAVGDALKVLSEEDYTVSYPEDSIDAGTYAVTVTLRNNYTGENTREFIIAPELIENAQISLEKNSYSYTGSVIEPAVTVSFNGMPVSETDYTVTYSSNKNAGVRNVHIEGTGNFKSSVKKQFTVNTVSIKDASVSEITDVTYTGSYHKPQPTVTWKGQTLTNGKDYVLSYENNLNAGTAKVIITGCATANEEKTDKNFTGEITVKFKITPLPLSDYSIAEISNRTYTGSEIVPGVSLMKGEKRLASSQYKLTFKNNVNAGTATVTATGTGNYEGSISRNFTIVPKNNTPRIYLSETSYVYDGKAKKPKVEKITVGTPEKELDSSQYTVKYSSGRKNVGTYHVTVTLRNNYNGQNTRSFVINPQHISEAKIKLTKRTYTYSGKACKPSVKVTANGKTLVKNTDYKVYYSANTLSGTGSVVIEGIGNYKGKSSSQSFVIRKATQKFKVTVAAKAFSLSASALKESAQTLPVSKTLKISKAVGAITYDLGYSSAGYFSVNQSTGAITVAKGAPKGTYELTIRLCAAGNANTMTCYRLADLVIVVK